MHAIITRFETHEPIKTLSYDVRLLMNESSSLFNCLLISQSIFRFLNTRAKLSYQFEKKISQI